MKGILLVIAVFLLLRWLVRPPAGRNPAAGWEENKEELIELWYADDYIDED
ncbi:MAG: hypothetical protein KBS68_03545 [Clostridiales bacterium]|nr:hypothetical protein [Candidatus Crickella merdequi]